MVKTEAEQQALIAALESAALRYQVRFGYVLAAAGVLLCGLQAVLGVHTSALEPWTKLSLWLGAASFALSSAIAAARLSAWQRAVVPWLVAGTPVAVSVLSGARVPTTGAAEHIAGEQDVISWVLLPFGPVLFAATCRGVARAVCGDSAQGIQELRRLTYKHKGA